MARTAYWCPGCLKEIRVDPDDYQHCQHCGELLDNCQAIAKDRDSRRVSEQDAASE